MTIHRKIKDIGYFFGGLTGKTKEDFDTGNSKFVSYMTVFTNPILPNVIKDYVSVSENEKQNRIQKGDVLFTGSSETPDDCGMSCVVTKDVDENIYLNSFCFGFRLYENEIILPSYLAHYFRCHYARKQITKTANGVTRFNISKKLFAEIDILIPNIKVQEEIVEILDSFTNLIEALNEELSLRQKQFEYYREKLLTFDDASLLKSINEIGTLYRGNGLQKKDFVEEGTGCIHYGQIYTKLGFSLSKPLTYVTKEIAKPLTKVSKGDLVIACTSENVEDVCKSVVWEGEEEIVTGGHACVFRHNENPRYIGYFFQTRQFFMQKKQYVYGAKVIDIKTEKLGAILIPIPLLSIQQSIVTKLDAFESLISSLKEEIALRQKQYEYYREKLLTFD